MQQTLITYSETETEALGATLGRLLQPGDVLALVGDLGAGKTCLAKGVARGLGIDEPVTSPTFILVAEYATAAGFPLYHADCYRLEQAAAEAQAIGLDELLLDDGVAVVEWAERIEPLLPADHLRITIEVIDDTRRQLTFDSRGPRAAQLLEQSLADLPDNGHLSIVNGQLSMPGDRKSDDDRSLAIDH
jgi:tRNA threonylcarbamoyladenosine biosynthesis protein TsaE